MAALLSGCVRSRVVVTSEPPGATIHMNDLHLGKTPVEMPFTWYWYYDFQAQLEGYETAVERKRLRAPVYLWPGLDLLMEAMPFPVYDTKRVHLVLREQKDRPDPEMVSTPAAGE
jgi:hypothetical protein